MCAVISLDDRRGAILDGPDAAALAKTKEVAELLAEVRGTVSAARERIESRESYQPSPAAGDSQLYSGRYDGHILRSRQLFGLARRRGWHGGFLSDAYDGGGTASAHRDFPPAGLRVSWWLESLEPEGDTHTELCLTGRLIFSTTGDAEMTPIPLADVPPELFSEAMRDLDLFVSVTRQICRPPSPRDID